MKAKILLATQLVLYCFSSFGQKTTYIQGISSDSSVNNISIWYHQGESSIRFKQEKGIFTQQLINESSKIYCISADHSPCQEIFITPGDSVFFITDTIKNQSSDQKRIILKFSGENSAHYNYSYLVSQYAIKPSYRQETNASDFRKQLVEWKNKQEFFLEQYRQQEKVTDEFYNWVKADIVNNYVSQLFSPLLNQRSVIEKDDWLKECLKDTVLPVVHSLSFQCRRAMLLKHVYAYTDNLYANFESFVRHVLQDFGGAEQELLLTAVIELYASMGDAGYYQAFQELIILAPQIIQNPTYLADVQKSESSYSIINKPFPEEVLSGTYLEEYGSNEKILLKTLLQKYEGKVIYIDFWASWCYPCRDNISKSGAAKDYLKKKSIVCLYISCDNKESSWQKAVEEENISQNQYRLLDTKNLLIAYLMPVQAIPRYIILGKDGKIINANAPRPIPNELYDLKNCVENLFK